MNTAWDLEHSARKARIAATPGRADVIEAAYRSIPPDIRDFTFQHSTRGPNIADKEVAVEMVTAINRGALACIHFEVGEGPQADENVDANSEALQGFPDPWTALVERTSQFLLLECDGRLTWTKPVTMYVGDKPVTIDPASVPLEIGYMPSGKASYGMRKVGLARWPYGSTTLTVIWPLASQAISKC